MNAGKNMSIRNKIMDQVTLNSTGPILFDSFFLNLVEFISYNLLCTKGATGNQLPRKLCSKR